MSAALELRRFEDQATAVQVMAREGAACLRDAIAAQGSASLVLTGGSAPGDLYRRWASDYAEALDWRLVHFFWGDERAVPHDDPESNVMTAAPLFTGIAVNPDFIHPWRTDLAPAAALADMREVLAKAGILQRGFDLTLLGVGPDGHVASLFPGHEPWHPEADHPSCHGIVAYLDDSPKPPAGRYTFTLPLLNASRTVYLLPFGKTKQHALDGLLRGDESMTVSHISACERLVTWTDLAA